MADDGGDRPLFSISEVTDWEAAKRQAAALLTPTQFAAFKALVDQQRLEHEQMLARESVGAPAAEPGK